MWSKCWIYIYFLFNFLTNTGIRSPQHNHFHNQIHNHAVSEWTDLPARKQDQYREGPMAGTQRITRHTPRPAWNYKIIQETPWHNRCWETDIQNRNSGFQSHSHWPPDRWVPAPVYFAVDHGHSVRTNRTVASDPNPKQQSRSSINTVLPIVSTPSIQSRAS